MLLTYMPKTVVLVNLNLQKVYITTLQLWNTHIFVLVIVLKGFNYF
ncbi:hypothetical protein SP99_04586 [Enterobacter sp. BIDMC92]|nr:hypothetical protein SP99_04586 [Enterobacter sp. BIDMC92]